MNRKRVVWVIVLALFLLSLACGESTPSVQVSEGNGEESATQEPEEEQDVPVGSSRSNPAPVGSEVTVDNVTLTVEDFQRSVDDVVSNANQFNTEPEEGQEYVVVELTATCEKDSDETCSIGPAWNLAVLGSGGVAHDAEWFISGVEGQLEQSEFYGGASVSGKLFFIVDQDETDLVLRYEELLGSDAAFLALE